MTHPLRVPALVAATLVMSTAVPAGTQVPQWRVLSPAHSPPPRRSHSMALDETRGRIILFGGIGSNGPLDDTWEWDGDDWSLVSSSVSPSPRDKAAMAWSPGSQSVLLFGGSSGSSALNDTWSLGAGGWMQLQPVSSPRGADLSAMVHDATANETLLLVGSQNGIQTWSWVGSTWIPILTNSPWTLVDRLTASHNHAEGGVELAVTRVFGTTTELWQWRNRSWSLFGTDPLLNSPWAMQCDRRRNVMVYGSLQLAPPFPPVVLLDRTGQLFLQQAYPATQTPLVWDPNRQTQVGFGSDAQGAAVTVEYGILRFPGSANDYGIGCPPMQPLALHASGVPHVGQPFDLSLAGVPPDATLAAAALGFSRSRLGAFSLPLALDFFQMPGCSILQSMEEPGIPVVLTPPTGSISIPIPSRPELARLRIHLQSTILAPSVNANGVATSNGVEARIGD